jgi:predicted nucleic acid-binding protein
VRRLHLDTNVIVRALFAEDGDQGDRARRLLLRSEAGGIRLLVSSLVVSEVLYIVERHFGVATREAASTLRDFLSHRAVACPERVVLRDALERHAATGLDFVDCYLAALSAGTGAAVCSFDRDYRKFPDVQRFEP